MTNPLPLSPRRLPIIQTAEQAECGLACLAMIGSYHGHKFDLIGLRRRYPISLKGLTLRSVMNIASQMQLAPRAFRAEINTLSRVKLPAIIHWDLNHFVVLKSITGKRAVVHDPAFGVRKLSLPKLSEHFTGIVVELIPADTFSGIEATTSLKPWHLWSKTTGAWNVGLQIVALSAILQLIAFAIPLQIQLVIDQAIEQGDLDFLLVIAIGFGLLVIIHALLEAIRNWSLYVLGSNVLFQIVGNIFRHLVRLPTSYFEKRHVGDIISRIGSTKSIQEALTHGMIGALIDGSMALIAIAVMFIYSATLAAIVLSTLLFYIFVTALFYRSLRERSNEQLISSAIEQSYLMETVRAATTIKGLNGEVDREATWRNRYADSINSELRFDRLGVLLKTFQEAIIGIQTVAVIYIGARLVLAAGGFSIGMLMAFLSFKQTFSDRIVSLIKEVVQFRLLRVHLDRLADIVTMPAEVRSDDVYADSQNETINRIELVNVSFRYGLSDALVLENVNLAIDPGEFIAIIGPSGGGKTTLFKLLLGLHRPTSGELFINGIPASTASWQYYRAQIGAVMQDDVLLSGTIAENIAFFQADLDMKSVIDASKAAGVHEDILRMPMQYRSLIGDMGSSLSGGQRQRVLLARALYRRPSILLLDEGTANLDDLAEQAIADRLSDMKITRVAIAHRPALVARASRVFEVSNGKIRELSK